MGRFKVAVELANNDDVRDASRGLLDPAKVRRATIQAVVDSARLGWCCLVPSSSNLA